jgi:FkbM family methyltransferase
VAIDPDPSNQEILKQSFLKYRLAPKPVVIVGKAVSDHRGKETMWVEQPGSAMNTLNPKWVDTLRHDPSRFGTRLDFGAKQEVETITLEELIQSHGTPLYVKIDVEGYEASVLRGLRTAVPFVSFEVNLPEFKPEAVQCVELLERVAANGVFNYTADCVQGLVLERWLPATAFLGYLDSCEDPCIEIFWDSTGGSEGIPSSVTVRQSVHGAESTRRTGC